jgi:hypothetical protein
VNTKQIVRGVGVVVVLVVIGVGWFLSANSAGSAAVGECLKDTGGDSMEKVDCGTPEAAYRVVARIEDKKSSEAEAACAEFESATSIYWEGKKGRFQNAADAKGAVLCLEPTA